LANDKVAGDLDGTLEEARQTATALEASFCPS
jgi:hypothetical protein